MLVLHTLAPTARPPKSESVEAFESSVAFWLMLLVACAVQTVIIVLLVRWMIRVTKTLDRIAHLAYEVREEVKQVRVDAGTVARQLTQS